MLDKYEAIEKSRRRKDKKIHEAAAREVEKIKQQAAQTVERLALPPLASPFDAEATRQREAEDEQIMALMAMLMLED